MTTPLAIIRNFRDVVDAGESVRDEDEKIRWAAQCLNVTETAVRNAMVLSLGPTTGPRVRIEGTQHYVTYDLKSGWTIEA